MKQSFAALAILACAGKVLAWGAIGHQTVGYVAMQFLAPKALSFVQSTITDADDNSLGPAATWADSVRSTAAFKFTAPFHFVDAEDDPKGGSCSVNESRDCGSTGCILTAIANYTQRVADTSLASEQRLEALKFIDHFLGDIGQPLHVEALETGGNDISAVCGSAKTNLHAAWDTGILTKTVNANFSGSAETWANSLVKQIKTGSYKSLAANWISCSSTTKPLSTKRGLKEEIVEIISSRTSLAASAKVTPLACPLIWAQESNAFDCSVVFNFSTGQDLCSGTYFNAAIPVISLQIAKQGYRLAAWLNVIFDGATNLP